MWVSLIPLTPLGLHTLSHSVTVPTLALCVRYFHFYITISGLVTLRSHIFSPDNIQFDKILNLGKGQKEQQGSERSTWRLNSNSY